jgi:hypothetical protein
MDAKKGHLVEVRMPVSVEFVGSIEKIEQVDIDAVWDLATERYIATGNGGWLIEALRDLYRARLRAGLTLDWPERELLSILDDPPARLAAALSRPEARRESVRTTKRDDKIRAQYENELKLRPGVKKTTVLQEIAAERHLSLERLKQIVKDV